MSTATLEKVVITPKPITWHVAALEAFTQTTEAATLLMATLTKIAEVPPPEAPPQTSEQRLLLDRLTNAVQNLEDKPDLHRFFREQRMTGVVGSSADCIVARWLRKVLGVRVSVGGSYVAGCHHLDRIVVNLGPNVRRFIAGFDHGRYPDLMAAYRLDQMPF